MRKIYFLLFIGFTFLSGWFNLASSQTANLYYYTVSSGGTLDPMTGATTIVNPNVDDAPSTLQNIGFTFTYEGIAYTNFSVSPDGFIKLGGPAAVSQFTNSITSTTNIPKLFPFWDDLATGTTGSVRFVVTGTAPNQILIIEWFVTIPRNTTGVANSRMQAWLYETSNVIEFRYGSGLGPSTSASIGINGATSTNYISITTPAHTASTTTATNTVTQWPGSGVMYRFFPSAACSAPVGGTTTSSSVTVCPATNFTLLVSGSSFGSGATYQWESSANGTTWSNIPGATNPALVTSQTTATYYRRKITCGGTDDWSSSLLVAMNPPVNSFPWTENFDGLTSLGASSFPTCWVKQNGDWRSANNATTSFDANARSLPNFIQNAWSATNEFIWTPGFQLNAGTQYDFSFWFADYDGSTSWSAEVFYNMTPNSSGATQLGSAFLTSGTPAPVVYTEVKRSFTPSSSGVYYFGIRVNEPTGAPWYLNFDDFRLDEIPAADVGPTALIMPVTYCPSPTAFPMQVTIRNFGASTVDFSVNPSTITVNISGAGSGTLGATVNSGTLAVGASMNVPVSPSYALNNSGTYNFDVNVTTLADGNAGNDNYDTTVVINQYPAVELGPDTTVCLNDGIVLNPGAQPAGSSFLWSTGATTPTYTAFTSGTYFVDVTSPLLLGPGPRTFTTNTPVNIFDNATVNSPLTVSGLRRTTMGSNSINQVCINITHTWDDDMDIRLVSPSGTIMDLSIGNGGSGDNYTNTCFSPTATVPITAGSPPFTGTFLPQGSFTSFNGQNPNGTWQLRVTDNFSGDQGTITNWSITFNDSIPTPGTGCKSSDTVRITLNPQPVVNLGPDGVVCQGFSRTLDAGNQPAGSTFLWNTGATTRTISVNTTGLYWVEVTNSLGCFKRDSINITVVAPPTVNLVLPFDTLYANSPIQLLGGGSPAGVTGIYSGPGISGTSINPRAFQQGNHTVTYTFTDQNGCTSSATDRFTIIPKADKVNVLPNPSTDGNFLVVVTPDLIGASMTAYNQVGQKVGQWNIGGMYNQITFPPHRHTPASGRYILRIEKAGVIITKQLVIAR